MNDEKPPRDLQIWVEARERFRLSHAHIAMARELGLNPQQLGTTAKSPGKRHCRSSSNTSTANDLAENGPRS